MTPKWLLPAIGSLILWGVWGLLLKIASTRIDWRTLYALTNTAAIVAIAFMLVTGRIALGGDAYPLGIAVAAGAFGTIGYMLLMISLQSGGRASIIIPLTSLYPAITVILSRIVLKEPIKGTQALGVVLAMIAIILLTR